MITKQQLIDTTDVTAIGYKSYLAKRMMSDPDIKRVCVDLENVNSARWSGKTVSCVVGFPFGDATNENIDYAITEGAHELDIPIPLRMLSEPASPRPGILEAPEIFNEWIRGLNCRTPAVFKFILHTDLIQTLYGDEAWQLIESLSHSLKTQLNDIYRQGRLYLKSCTGYGPGGADPQIVKMLSDEGYKVKASGGIRTLEAAEELLNSGAELLGIGYDSYKRILTEIEGGREDL